MSAHANIIVSMMLNDLRSLHISAHLSGVCVIWLWWEQNSFSGSVLCFAFSVSFWLTQQSCYYYLIVILIMLPLFMYPARNFSLSQVCSSVLFNFIATLPCTNLAHVVRLDEVTFEWHYNVCRCMCNKWIHPCNGWLLKCCNRGLWFQIDERCRNWLGNNFDEGLRNFRRI